MAIIIHGPAWPTTLTLRTALADAPENGTFYLGGPRYDATTQLARFRAAGLRTPDFTATLTEARAWLSQGHIVLGRREAHTQGRDIAWAGAGIRPGRRWSSRSWWSKYVSSSEEWRLHIFNGSSIARGRKVYTADGAEPGGVVIRSRSRGWTLDHTVRPNDAIRSAAKTAVAALPGYLYGAVDILVTNHGDPVVLEVNRMPAVRDDYTRMRYVDAIRQYVRENPDGASRAIASPEWYEGYEVL